MFYFGDYPQYYTSVISPLREESNPSCVIYPKSDGGLWLVDHGIGFQGDIFDIINYISGGGMHFMDVLKTIADDMGIPYQGCNKPSGKELIIPQPLSSPAKKTRKTQIRFQKRKWNLYDMVYWSGYSISRRTLQEYNVFPVRQAWINDRLFYGYTSKDPCYAYVYRKNKSVKLYFPQRISNKFIGSYGMELQGYEQLPEKGDKLIITKSTKDIMCFREIRIPAVAPHGEVHKIHRIDELRKRFKHIISWYDFDYTGLVGSGNLKRNSGIPRFTLSDGSYNTIDYGGFKDPADFTKSEGLDELKSFTLNVFRRYFT